MMPWPLGFSIAFDPTHRNHQLHRQIYGNLSAFLNDKGRRIPANQPIFEDEKTADLNKYFKVPRKHSDLI